MSKTCFVISPIGSEGSETRKDADEFLEYLVEPSLEKYNFDVIRADKIPRPTVITSDIIRLVQESDLCIIDITNSNPNVFYECGRRHETGRPFLQMIKKGSVTDIPFDVAGIRTIEYDLSTTGEARRSVKELQSFIDEIVNSGFSEKSAGHTMASIGDALARIERKISGVLANKSGDVGRSQKIDRDAKIQLLMAHPVNAFYTLLEDNDFPAALSITEKVKLVSDLETYLSGLGILAAAGYEPAIDVIEKNIDATLNEAKTNLKLATACIKIIAESYDKFYTNTGQQAEGIEKLEKLYELATSEDHFPNETLAHLAWKVSSLAYRCDDHEKSKVYDKITTKLCPETPSYWFNLVLACEFTNDKEVLINALKNLKGCENLDEDHLALIEKHSSII